MKVTINNPSQSNVALNASQNFFNNKKDRLVFTKGSFIFYTISFFPMVISSLWVYIDRSMGDIMLRNPKLPLLGGIFGIAFCFILAYSKIASRKFPYSYILLALYVICFSVMFAGIEATFPIFAVSLTTLLIANGLGITFYAIITKTDFRFHQAFICAFGALLMPLLFLLYYFDTDRTMIIGEFIAILLLSCLLIHTSKVMVLNKNFEMLPNDYIMGSMRLVAIIPLIPDMMFDGSVD